MLTAFLKELQLAFPKSQITLLGPAKAKILLTDAPMLSRLWSFNKKKVLGDDGWIATLSTSARLTSISSSMQATRQALQPHNPTNALRACIADTELWSARSKERLHTDGRAAFTTNPRKSSAGPPTEPLGYTTNEPQLPDLGHLTQRPSPSIEAWLEESASKEFVVINIGARLQEKQLQASDYRQLIQSLAMLEFEIVLTYGPSEFSLAEQSAQDTSAKLAPNTDL